jgi:hypothetical protein
MMHTPLSREDYAKAARRLNLPAAALMAVGEVEAPRGGFLPSGQVTILLERHWFSRLTNGKYDLTHPQISNKSPGGYYGGDAEHSRLAVAVLLDREAALQATSWGKFQIMGFNYKVAGSYTLQGFINSVFNSEQEQLDLFCDFLKNKGLVSALQKGYFTTFARIYNGPDYAKHSYDTRLRDAYHRYLRQGVT